MWRPYVPAGTALPPNVNGEETVRVVFSFAPARQMSP
jgi:hypothetical protein